MLGRIGLASLEKAVETAPEPSAALLRDLATAYADSGDRERAIDAATRALERAGADDAARDAIRQDLERYRGG